MSGRKRVVVTGSSGFIGRHVTRLLRVYYDVIGWDLQRDSCDEGPVGYRRVDLRDEELTRWQMQESRPDVVVHLAALRQARASLNDEQSYLDSNVEGTRNLLTALSPQTSHVIFTSSCSVFGDQNHVSDTSDFNPLSPYARTKILCEQLMGDYAAKHRVTVLRPFNVIGAANRHLRDETNDSLVRNFRQAITENRPLTIYGNTFDTEDGTAVREYVHVQDVADLILSSIRELSGIGAGLKAVNIARGLPLSVLQVAQIMNEAVGRTSDAIRYIESQLGDPGSITSQPGRSLGNWRPRQDVPRALEQEARWAMEDRFHERQL